MKNQIKTGILIACAAAVMASAGLVGCSSNSNSRTAGKVIDDATLTTKIKANLYTDPAVKGHEVSVTTYRGVVQLNGFVDTQEQKQRAGEIARSFPEVASVQNNLAVKPEPAGAQPSQQQAPETVTPSAPKEHDP